MTCISTLPTALSHPRHLNLSPTVKRTSAGGFSALTYLKKRLFWAAPFALTPIMLVMTAAALSGPTTYTGTNGDFILGFRQVGSTTSVLVDIGPITDFTAAQTFSLGSLGSVLSTNYGSGWATDANVYFSLAATTRPQDTTARTNYVTSAGYLTGINAGPAFIWGRLTNSTSLGLLNKITSAGNAFNTNSAALQSGTNAVLEPATSTDPDAYQNYMPGGTTDAGHATTGNDAYGFFNPTTEGNFGQGTSGVALDLIQLIPATGTSVNAPGNDLGIFQLSGDGNTLTFAVPEPSSYAAVALFGVLAFLGFRMHKARKFSTEVQSA